MSYDLSCNLEHESLEFLSPGHGFFSFNFCWFLSIIGVENNGKISTLQDITFGDMCRYLYISKFIHYKI